MQVSKATVRGVLCGTMIIAGLVSSARAQTLVDNEVRRRTASTLCTQFGQGVYFRKILRVHAEDQNEWRLLGSLPATPPAADPRNWVSGTVMQNGRRIYTFDRAAAPGVFIDRNVPAFAFINEDMNSVRGFTPAAKAGKLDLWNEWQPQRGADGVVAGYLAAHGSNLYVAGIGGGASATLRDWVLANVIANIGGAHIYNEMLVEYGFDSILGVNLEVPERGTALANNTNIDAANVPTLTAAEVVATVEKSIMAYVALLTRGYRVPLVKYRPANGSIVFYRSMADYINEVHTGYCVNLPTGNPALRLAAATVLGNMTAADCTKLQNLAALELNQIRLFEPVAVADAAMTCAEINVAPAAPVPGNCAYAAAQFTERVGRALMTKKPQACTNEPTVFAILPVDDWMHFDVNTGWISGTPPAQAPRQQYTVTPRNQFGNGTPFTIDITINP